MFARGVILFCCIWLSLIAVYALAIYRKLPSALKKLSFFIFFSAIIEVVSSLMWFNKINNMPLLHFYVAGAFLCIALFYREILGRYVGRTIFIWVVAVFVLFTIYSAIFLQPIHRFSSYTLTVESVLVIILSLSTSSILMNYQVKDSFSDDRKSIVWANSGFLIYYATNLLNFYFGDIFSRLFPHYITPYIWAIHSLFSMTMYTCFFIALWKHPKQNSPQHPQ